MNTDLLTTGNYVLVNGKAVKVESVSEDGIYYNGNFAHLNDVEPVFITEEFLGKNEFEKYGEHYGMIWCENYCVLATKIKYNLWKIHIQGDNANMDGGVTCVHELQNAMKICGIKKKIEV